jgi:hypothetical protein
MFPLVINAKQMFKISYTVASFYQPVDMDYNKIAKYLIYPTNNENMHNTI